MERKSVFVKLLQGTSWRCPDGTTLQKKKPLGPISASHHLMDYFRSRPMIFQVIEEVGRGPARRRRPRGGRGGLPPQPVIETVEAEIGASIEELQAMTRKDLVERVAKYNLDIAIKKNMSKADVAQAVYDAERDMLSGDDSDDD